MDSRTFRLLSEYKTDDWINLFSVFDWTKPCYRETLDNREMIVQDLIGAPPEWVIDIFSEFRSELYDAGYSITGNNVSYWRTINCRNQNITINDALRDLR